MKWSARVSGFVFAALLAAVPALAEAELSGTNPAQWRLIWKHDPAHEATVSWNTAEPGEDHYVLLREADAAEAKKVACHRSGRYSDSDDLELYFHHARLQGLKPATTYLVTLVSDGQKSPEMHFMTAPEEERSFSILFGGDSRSGLDARRRINRMMARMVSETPSILAFAHGGDYVANGRDLDQWSEWMSAHELTVTSDGRLLPIIPTRGNHDRGPLFNEIFDFPEDDANFYDTSLGPMVRLFTLNTEAPAGGDQQRWLQQELDQSRPAFRWLLAQYHRPAYPAVKSPSEAYTFWVPLFERFNLDLALEADGHCIKRTAPIRNDRVDETGVVYLGEGGLGVGQRSPKTDRWYLQPTAKACSQGHHLHVITFDREKMHVQVIRLGGEKFDEFYRSARGS